MVGLNLYHPKKSRQGEKNLSLSVLNTVIKPKTKISSETKSLNKSKLKSSSYSVVKRLKSVRRQDIHKRYTAPAHKTKDQIESLNDTEPLKVTVNQIPKTKQAFSSKQPNNGLKLHIPKMITQINKGRSRTDMKPKSPDQTRADTTSAKSSLKSKHPDKNLTAGPRKSKPKKVSINFPIDEAYGGFA